MTATSWARHSREMRASVLFSTKPSTRWKNGEATKSPLKVGDTFVVLGVTNRHEADLAEFDKQKEQLKQAMLSGKQSQIYEDYISAVQQRMKQDGKIKSLHGRAE